MPRLPLPYTHAEMMRDRKRDTARFQKEGPSGRARVMMTINMKFEGKPLPGPVLTDIVMEDGSYFTNDDPKNINDFNYSPGVFRAIYSDLNVWNKYLKAVGNVNQTNQILQEALTVLQRAFESEGDLETKAELVADAYRIVKNKKSLVRKHSHERDRLGEQLEGYGYDLKTVTEEDFKV